MLTHEAIDHRCGHSNYNSHRYGSVTTVTASASVIPDRSMKEGKTLLPPTAPLANYSFTSPSKPTKRPFSNRIEDYELKELLGRGGFGFVHKAISKSRGSYGREVAIKMIDKKLMKASNMTRRVANEVEIHWQLHHPAVLELYNYFEDSQYVYLVMEQCKQGELYRYIQKRKQPLSEMEARTVLSQITRGLLYLHANGIIHRDLKLSNLLLTDTFDVKIADFGLAVKLAEPDGEQKTMCGTPNYISPEIVSRQPYGLMSDVWSLGCMVVTLLTGTPPFESSAVKQTLDRVSRVDYILPDHLSIEAKDLIHRLLQKNPKRRLPLNKVLSHPFFSPSLPLTPLRPLSVECTKKSIPLQSETKARPVDPPPLPPPRAASHSRPNGVERDPQPQFRTPEPDRRASKDDINQQLPPFSTIRLKALKQKTKHGNVAILNTGWLYLDFVDEPYLLMISPDSQQIDFYERNCDPTTDQHTARPFKSCSRQSLPSSYFKKYRYACRFVDLVRSKTPKVLFYSPQAKSILMENGPLADFEMVFYSDVKVHYSVAKNSLQITCKKPGSIGTETHTVDTSNVANLSLQPHIVPIFKHVQECLRQCLDVEASAKSDGTTKYPIIVKASGVPSTSNGIPTSSRSSHSPTLSLHPSSMSNYTSSAPGNTNGHRSNATGSNGQPSEAVEGLASTGIREHNDQKSRPVSSISTRSECRKSALSSSSKEVTATPQPATAALSTTSERDRNGHSNRPKHVPPRSAVSEPGALIQTRSSGGNSGKGHAANNGHGGKRDDAVSAVSCTSNGTNKSSNSSNHQAVPCFLKGVGWCVRIGDGRFLMVFNDGIAVTVEAKHQTLLYCDYNVDASVSERYVIDRNLPDRVKCKLVHFPVFLKMFTTNTRT
ncbi:hypothetical protein SeLEV6574_g00253 [Synchytrium endobioticum]|nr:hypothetical protein SeLEV6574_g00253 [Synchytrium endobioticum]